MRFYSFITYFCYFCNLTQTHIIIAMKKNLCLSILTLLLPFFLSAQLSELHLNNNWKAKRVSDVNLSGEQLTTRGFSPSGWMEAVVPGTVLTTLLHNNQIPDPFFGMNNNLIPDVYDTGRGHYTYWFYNEFDTPAMDKNSQVWLSFRGLNYFADFYLNGHRLNAKTHEGMYLREKFNITPYLNKKGKNRLAVWVAPPDPVGNPERGQAGDGMIAKNVTMQFTAGWDWICPIRDRNTGIWDKVTLEVTKAVDIRHPYIETSVPGKRTPGGNQASAFVKPSVEVKNTSGKRVTGTLTATLEGIQKSVKVTLSPFEEKTVVIPGFEVKNPRLWWPNGMGEQPLYNIKIDFKTGNSKSDSETVTFGIRETGNYFDTAVKAQVFTVNGQKVFIKGGNWIASDALLRLSKERYGAEVRLHAGMNMNMIRIWGGGLTERSEFYEACDKYGILVWQDLWITGDGNGEWEDKVKKESQEVRKKYPDNHALFLESVVDQVKMLRNHPSLYLWCGGNETYPPDDILQALENDIFPKYDPKRFFLDKSTSPKLMTNSIGGVGDGPYGIREPEDIFNTRSFPFNPETGSIGIPNYEGLKKIIPENELFPPVDSALSESWRYHKFIPLNNFPDRYGKVKDAKDFCVKSQLVQYEQYRALQEAFNYKMWDWYTGMLVWKNQNPWTALRGSFYDYYLDYNGGYFGFKHAAAPVHIQLNLNDSSVCVLNQTAADVKDVTAVVRLYGLHGNLISKQTHELDIASNQVKLLDKIRLPEAKGVFFLKLELKKAGKAIDENLYWLTNTPRSYEKLNELKKTDVTVSLREKNQGKISVQLSNQSKESAFFIRLKTVNEKNELILPTYFSDNYITLLPRESKILEMELPSANVQNARLVVEGCNVEEKIVQL